MPPASTPARPMTVRADGPGRMVLESAGATIALVVGYDGPSLPRQLNAALLEQTGPGAWRLSAAEGEFAFSASGVERFEPLPDLFDALLAPFALKPRDRMRVGVLLKLLRLPGGAWLLRRWHSRRR